MAITLDETVRDLGLTEVLTTGQHDYSWSEFRAWRHPSGRFYWFADSGCSCSEYGDGFTAPADLGDGDRDALERALRAWHAEHFEECPDQVMIDCVEKLRQLPRS
jgi:hypothetical protein